MRSLLGGVAELVRRPRNGSPVPYTARSDRLATVFDRPAGQEAQLRSMGAVGTLFAIVNRTSTSTAAVDWALWRKAPSGRPEDRTPVERHAALDLWNTPNQFFSREELVESEQQHLDLTGEGWLVVARDSRFRSLPLELWPVRPDRMFPIPHRDEFIAGYMYVSPDGERIPLERDQVIFTRMPNPLDPFRGMGPVQSILTDLRTDTAQKEWNEAFFRNSAEPGGILEVEKRLSDGEFAEMTARWAEQHKGVGNAHRVAVIEQGHWVDRNITQRDMQFIEGMGVTTDAILRAFGMPKFAVGMLDDVNRATADASDRWFDKHFTLTRLARFKGALNRRLLPMYGPAAAAGLEFDFTNPVGEDGELANAERDSKVQAAVSLIGAGFDRVEVLAAFGLPDIAVAAAPLVAAATAQPELVPAARLAPAAQRALPAGRPRNAPDLDPDELPDVSPLQGDWEEALAALLADWAPLSAEQKDRLVEDVRKVAESGALTDLTDLQVDTAATSAELAAAMVAIAAAAAARVVEEAAEQGVTVKPRDPAGLADVAAVVAYTLASSLVLSAVAAALRANGPAATADDIAAAVRAALDGLTDALPEQQLGGALTGAQNAGRIETLRLAPEGALYANEKNDKSTCSNCRSINGKWLGNISQMDQVEASYPGGAYGGYVNCLGRERCRGTVVGVWR